MLQSPFEVLYEDNHLLVVVKPAGLLTQETDLDNHSLENLAKAWLKEKYKKPFNVFLGVVHRLDKPASGIVLFAKTSKALSRLNDMIRSKETTKVYCALIEGKLPKESGTLEHFLRHGDHMSFTTHRGDPEAKFARLHYDEIWNRDNKTLVQIVLETGRYHQIRNQFSAIGCPIIGDAKYGSRLTLSQGIIALHHYRLQLIHPVTKAALSFEAPLPDIFK
ncbi:MAG: RNA pseudouridine synthase [Parachlamydiaceae bacterium]|nr:RNA pseudouridine synthase [Parachlamydiaceae bacterium]